MEASNWYATGVEAILPRQGFAFPPNHKIFDHDEDWISVKWALQAQVSGRTKSGVDAALAAIMVEANRIAGTVVNSPVKVPVTAVFESARKFYSWTKMVKDDCFPGLMLDLISARRAYKKLASTRGLADHDNEKKQGQRKIVHAFFIEYYS